MIGVPVPVSDEQHDLAVLGHRSIGRVRVEAVALLVSARARSLGPGRGVDLPAAAAAADRVLVVLRGLFRRPQVALLVREVTLLPVRMPLAPAATLLPRLGRQLAVVLAAHSTPQPVIDTGLQQMVEIRLARTANRAPGS